MMFRMKCFWLRLTLYVAVCCQCRCSFAAVAVSRGSSAFAASVTDDGTIQGPGEGLQWRSQDSPLCRRATISAWRQWPRPDHQTSLPDTSLSLHLSFQPDNHIRTL